MASDVSGLPPYGPAPDATSAADARARRFAVWVVGPLLTAFIAIVLVFYVLFGVSRVVGSSMVPNLRSEDGLLLTKGYTTPRRGDIVVLKVPGQFGGTEEVVKRVVGIPGDIVEVRAGQAWVNGKQESGYTVIADPGDPSDNFSPYKVAAGAIYIMGDNRPISYDSRYMGAQPLSAVNGRAVAIYSPVTRLQLIKRLPAGKS